MNINSENLNCEEIRLLGSADLSGTLSREESQKLFSHLQECSDCSDFMKEISSLDFDLANFGSRFEEKVLDENFNQNLKEKISQINDESNTVVSLKTESRFQHWLVGGLTGAIAALLVMMLLTPRMGPDKDSTSGRFQLHPIAFEETREQLDWNQPFILQPGQGLKHTVVKSHDFPYHFRLKSDSPVNVVFSHEGSNTVHRFELQGVHYASLYRPTVSDVVILRNEGTKPIEISYFTQGQENALEPEQLPL